MQKIFLLLGTLFSSLLFSGPNEWVDHYPEITWLADKEVRHTEEGHASLKGSYSEQLFGEKYIEFDRTLMTLHCLQLILDGSDKAYQKFTAAQPENVRLSRENFRALHTQGKALLESGWGGLSEKEMVKALETALVLGDMGKSKRARELFAPYGAAAPDHDDFHGEAMRILRKDPSLSPSFSRLPAAAKRLLIETANLAHYGHITHLEGGLEMFASLKGEAISDPVMLAFDLFVHTCDVAGALGHVNNQSSIVYNERTYLAIEATGKAIRTLAQPNASEEKAYHTYLNTRAEWLGLDPNDRFDRVLTRIGAMLRLFTPEDGNVLKEAMNALDPETRNHIATQLDVQENVRTPTYMPAVLVNLSLSKAVTIGLPFIARVLEQHKMLVAEGKIDPEIPLCFNQAAGVAKVDPERLNGEFQIDKEGNIFLDL